MRVLVTGISGFVGRHLAVALQAAGHEALELDAPVAEGGVAQPVDIREPAAVDAAVARLRPDACVHLAAVAFVPDAERDMAGLFAVNLAGTLHVADALLRHVPHARLVFVSSAQVYGPSGDGEVAPVAEDVPLRPVSAYAVSKAAAELALLGRHRAHGLDVVIARPDNHTGPGQSACFVVPAFVDGLRAVRDGRAAAVPVGNLASMRSFTDVRDVAEAYVRLLCHGRVATAYNISADAHLPIREVLTVLAAIAGVPLRTVVDSARFRPTDASPLLDTRRLRQDIGWAPRYALEQTLRDLWQA